MLRPKIFKKEDEFLRRLEELKKHLAERKVLKGEVEEVKERLTELEKRFKRITRPAIPSSLLRRLRAIEERVRPGEELAQKLTSFESQLSTLHKRLRAVQTQMDRLAEHTKLAIGTEVRSVAQEVVSRLLEKKLTSIAHRIASLEASGKRREEALNRMLEMFEMLIG